MPVKKIPTSEVEIGMFVTSLDRPWSETPFLFQGFLVRDIEEIEDLLKYTQHVFIMVPDEEIELHAMSTDHTPQVATTKTFHKKVYRTESELGDEVLNIKADHEELSSLVYEFKQIADSNPELIGQRLEQPIKVMVSSISRNPDAYVWLTRLRNFDSYLYRDSLLSSIWAAVFGRQLGLEEEELQVLATGAMLMDIGKTALPESLLNKQPRLSHDEWQKIKYHIQYGLKILAKCPSLHPDVLDIVRTHHERIDGSGYPFGLARSQIPIFGQMAGIVDFYVSVTSPRPYAETIAPSMAIQMLYEQRERYFDETLVEQFIKVLGTYPTGSLVELTTGEVGVVVSQNPGLRLKPNVMILLDNNKQPYDAQPIVNIAQYTFGTTNKPVAIVKTVNEGKYGISLSRGA